MTNLAHVHFFQRLWHYKTWLVSCNYCPAATLFMTSQEQHQHSDIRLCAVVHTLYHFSCLMGGGDFQWKMEWRCVWQPVLQIILLSIFNHSKVVDYQDSCCLPFGKVWSRYLDREKTDWSSTRLHLPTSTWLQSKPVIVDFKATVSQP